MKEFSDKNLLQKPMIDDTLFKNGISSYETGLSRDERFIINKIHSDIIQKSDLNKHV
jgi:hypothetical protein